MLVILTVNLFYCPEQRWKIAFTTDEQGNNLPKTECESWMHWKSTTISGDISDISDHEEVKDMDIIKGLMNEGFYIGSESKMNLEFGLY
ncbi:MAG: hypothetical protein AAF149_20390 [Bacteroidota bacterium]